MSWGSAWTLGTLPKDRSKKEGVAVIIPRGLRPPTSAYVMAVGAGAQKRGRESAW